MIEYEYRIKRGCLCTPDTPLNPPVNQKFILSPSKAIFVECTVVTGV